ncbi:hypothetical protein TB2_017719 [Malus domestica]
MGNSVRNLNLQSKEELKSSPADAEQTKSLEDYYRKSLKNALHLQHINAVNSSHKLTMRKSLGFLWRLEEAGFGVGGGDGGGEEACGAEEGGVKRLRKSV